MAALLALIAVCASSAHSQSAPTQRLQVSVSVADWTTGAPIRNLSAHHFQVKVGGQPATVQMIPAEPVRLIVLLDRSASITNPLGFWKNVLAATARLVRMAPSEWSIGLMTFASDQTKLVDIDAARESTRQALADLRDLPRQEGNKRTALCDSISAAFAHLGSARSGDVILVVADGNDNVSQPRCTATATTLQRGGVRLFGLGLPTAGMPRADWPVWDLQQLSRKTGGDVAVIFFNEVWISQLMEEAFQRLLSQIGDRYTLEVHVAAAAVQPTSLEIVILDDKGKRRGNLNVRHPARVVPRSL